MTAIESSRAMQFAQAALRACTPGLARIYFHIARSAWLRAWK